MFYYQCKRCNYISKQKIDMKRHLNRRKKCIIKEENILESENKLYDASLIKHEVNKELESIIKDSKNLDDNSTNDNSKVICEFCTKSFHNKSNLNKHLKCGPCNNTEKIIHQVNNIQNIGVQNNVINININSLRGFDEDWNISNITKDMREKLLLSDKKFTNTLENILKNDENLNIILKDKVTGLVYKIKNNEYEIMPVKDIFEETMFKIYKHLSDFFNEIIVDNENDIRMNILENELKEVDKKYSRYKKSLITSNDVNLCLSNIIDDKKNDAIKQFMKINLECNELDEGYINAEEY